MKLSLKIPLAFAAALLLMFAGACYGIFALNQSIDVYRTTVQDNVANERMASATLVAFKLQVQEWKDTLLRGGDPAMLDKYWSAFQKREQTVDTLAAELRGRLDDGESRALVDQFITAHAAMGQGYRKGFDAFKAAGFVASAGDVAVKGVDRQPAALLEQAARKIAEHSAAVSAEATKHATHATIVSIVMMLVACAVSMTGGFLFSRTVSKPISRALDCAQAVATGDLTIELHTEGKDEIAQLLVALKDMQDSLSDVVRSVRDSAEGVATASAEIATGNLDLSARTEEQAASLEETAASMEELTSTVRHNVENASQALTLSTGAADVAARGREVMRQVVKTMHGITESSTEVAEIVGVIEAIALQTNILALNAAVEAARAGEQGRGFAVVASEVRALALRSGTAAKEIKELIGQSNLRVNAGSVLVSNAGEIIGETVRSVEGVTTLMGAISTASVEQSTGIEQVNTAVGQMDVVTQQNAALVEQASAAAQALAEQAATLRDAVSVFKLRGMALA